MENSEITDEWLCNEIVDTLKEMSRKSFPLTYVNVPSYVCSEKSKEFDYVRDQIDSGVAASYILEEYKESIIVWRLEADIRNGKKHSVADRHEHENTHAYFSGGFFPLKTAAARVAMALIDERDRNDMGGIRIISKLENKLMDTHLELYKKMNGKEKEKEDFVKKNKDKFKAMDEALTYSILENVGYLSGEEVEKAYGDLLTGINQALPFCNLLNKITQNTETAKAFGRSVLAKAREEQKDPIELLEIELLEYQRVIGRSFRWFDT